VLCIHVQFENEIVFVIGCVLSFIVILFLIFASQNLKFAVWAKAIVVAWDGVKEGVGIYERLIRDTIQGATKTAGTDLDRILELEKYIEASGPSLHFL
jgi:hypothetical protein